jgi:adenylate cyclase
VLFCDIRGSAAVAQRMDPFQMAKLLSDYFSEMVACVVRHGGTLDEFMGDALMARWGNPSRRRDDVDRALDAARDMLDTLDALNTRWTRQGRPTVQAGIGLNYGDAFAATAAAGRRLDHIVIGDTADTASRLCAVAAPGEILITENVRRALASPPPTAPVPPLLLRGKMHRVPVYRILR